MRYMYSQPDMYLRPVLPSSAAPREPVGTRYVLNGNTARGHSGSGDAFHTRDVLATLEDGGGSSGALCDGDIGRRRPK